MLNIITAFHAEARPLIEHFQLKKKMNHTLFESYTNKSNTISLCLSGLGKLSASAAVIHSANIFSVKKNHIWLNIGIAGHKSLEPGTPILANKLIDNASQTSWYPQIIFQSELSKGTLITVDRPCDDYPDNAIIDMEASGFYSSASRLGTCELIHCLKVISDNETNSCQDLDKHKIEELIRINLHQIESVIDHLKELACIIKEPQFDEQFFTKITALRHFTYMEKKQLKTLLIKWHVLLPGKSLDINHCNKLINAKQIIEYLGNEVEIQPISF